MNISPINNTKNSQPDFKGSYKIVVPKKLLPTNYGECLSECLFKDALQTAIDKKPKKFLNKILDKMGIVPEAITFMNYPGYERLNKYIKENGKVWTEQRLNFKYNLTNSNTCPGLELKIPDVNPDNYEFLLLTGVEKDCFLKSQKEVIKEANGLVKRTLYAIAGNGSGPIRREDYQLLRDIAITGMENMAFVASSGGEIKPINVKKLENIPKLLSRLINS